MKKTYIPTITAGLLMALASCEENKMDTYKNDPALYFEHKKYGQQDSISHSFFIYDEDVTFDTVKVVICTMGFPEDYDRPINLIQANAGQPDAAVPGVHFIPFDTPDMQKRLCIPAGAVRDSIPIVFLRDKSLETHAVRLELTIGSNEHFRPGIDEFRNFTLTTTGMAAKPSNWDDYKYIFGTTWGSVKMKLIIDSTGFTDFDNPPQDAGFSDWLRSTAKQALIDYNTAHPDAPLCEADGTPVTFD